MAKNKLIRALRALLDPPPSASAVAAIWQYFGSQCAYCGKTLSREKREGHLDHVRCVADGGSNSIHNRVLACGACNGDEKREESWESFLRKKWSIDGAQFVERKPRIERWMALAPTSRISLVEQSALIQILSDAGAAVDALALRVRSLREIRVGRSH